MPYFSTQRCTKQVILFFQRILEKDSIQNVYGDTTENCIVGIFQQEEMVSKGKETTIPFLLILP